MKAKDFRKSAWGSFSGKWGICILIFFICDLITAACAGGSVVGIGAIVGLLISGPLTLGLTDVSLRVARGKNVELETLFGGFNDFSRSLVLYITNDILIMLWSMLFVIPGIIKSYSYSMSYYIMLDDPAISANDARKKSMKLMQGNKWRLFCLDFSFIGWILLSCLTFGILMLWVAPCMEVARAKFYMSLVPQNEDSDDNVDNYYGDAEDLDKSFEHQGGAQDFKDDEEFL